MPVAGRLGRKPTYPSHVPVGVEYANPWGWTKVSYTLYQELLVKKRSFVTVLFDYNLICGHSLSVLVSIVPMLAPDRILSMTRESVAKGTFSFKRMKVVV